MKGLFATLLAVMMTGMVSGQQPQYSSFQSKQNAVSANGLAAKFLLVLDEGLLQGLRSQGSLSSRIDAADRESIDHIVFHGSDENSNRTDLNPVGIQPTSKTEGRRIVFELSEQMIAQMRVNGLIYILAPADRGRFEEVVVVYRKPASTTSAFNQIPIGSNPPVASTIAPPIRLHFLRPARAATWVWEIRPVVRCCRAMTTAMPIWGGRD